MSSVPLNQAYSIPEEEYLKLKRVLYKKLFKYMMTIFAATILLEIIRALYDMKPGILLNLGGLFVFGLVFLKLILSLQKNQELIITIFITLLYLMGMITHYHYDTGYFDSPLDSFYFAYGCALLERLIVIRIPDSTYRTVFSITTTLIRVLVIPPNQKGVYTIQFICLVFGVYFDLDKEKHDRELFGSYFNSREQLLKFKNLVVNDIPEGIMIVSQDLRKALFVNNSFTDLLGLDYSSNIRSQLSQFILQENFTRSNNESGSTFSAQNLLNFLEENRGQGKDGVLSQKISCNLTYTTPTPLEEKHQQNPIHLLEARLFPITWDEKEAIAIIMHDVTQQHMILNLKTANAQKDAILATVSHELRTPLNGMLGMIQVMQKNVVSQEMGQHLDICRKNGNLLMGLVNSILDLNHIRNNTLKLDPKRIDVREILNGIVGLFEFQCKQKGLFIKTEVAAGIRDALWTDENRLSQIFISLVGNALKFTSQGGITISANLADSEEYVEFSVKDTGIGIKTEDKNRLLKGLEDEGQNSGHGSQQGVGLGLTISNNLARILCDNEDLGGIRVRSQYKNGSVFSFMIKRSITNRRRTVVRPNLPPIEGSEEIEYKVKTHLTPVFKKPPAYPSLNGTTFARFPTLENVLSQSNLLDLKTQKYSSEAVHEASGVMLKDNGLSGEIAPTVLIVDDNPFNIAVADCLVTHQGYRVVSALYGQVAIDMVLGNNHVLNPIKLILMDCQMPVMDGYETTRVLRKLMKEKRIPEIPIVPLTANDSESDKAACKRAGMLDHLSKPLKESELVRVLRSYCS